MAKFTEQAIAKFKTRPISEQDSISILNENLSCQSNNLLI
jgi:hypothetical protein